MKAGNGGEGRRLTGGRGEKRRKGGGRRWPKYLTGQRDRAAPDPNAMCDENIPMKDNLYPPSCNVNKSKQPRKDVLSVLKNIQSIEPGETDGPTCGPDVLFGSQVTELHSCWSKVWEGGHLWREWA